MECPASSNNASSNEQSIFSQFFQLTTFPLAKNPVLQENTEIPSSSSLSVSVNPSNGILNEASDLAQKERRSPKKYSKVSNEKRLEIIEALENQGEKIKQVAERLGVNYSTVKSIYLVYKKEGRVKKKGAKKLLEKEDEPKSFQGLPENINNNSNNPVFSNPIKEDSPKRDKLTELRDRLLESRLGKREQPQDFQNPPVHKEIHSVSTNNIMQDNYNTTSGAYFEVKPMMINNGNMYQQSPVFLNYQQLGAPINTQNFQQGSYIVVNGDMNMMKSPYQQQNFVFQQTPIQPMMMINSQPQAFQNIPGNFVQPNMPMNGPTQTININNPQADNMNIRSFTNDENTASAKQDPQVTTQMYTPMMQPNQIQYLMMPLNNTTDKQNDYQQINQVQYMQPIMYMMPQMGSVQGNFPAGQGYYFNGGNMMMPQGGYMLYADNQQQKVGSNGNHMGSQDNNQGTYQN